MGWQPEQGSGRGENAASHPGLPGAPGIPAPARGTEGRHGSPRDHRLSGFAPGGAWDTCPPSAALAAALEGASGEAWRCPGATHDELIGLLRQWAALEARAAAGRLGVLRALMREEDLPINGGHHGDLPDGWSKSLTREVALALAVSAPGADHMMWLAWDLQARLPGIGRLLADGTLTYGKAKAIDEELSLLSDREAEQAEQLILAALGEDGSPKSFTQVLKIAQQAAVTVNPEVTALRRRDAEQTRARVTRFREQTGAAALCGRDLPTDEALSAYAHVNARAEEYQASEAFPDVRLDQLRAMAYVDLLTGMPADERIAEAKTEVAQADLVPDGTAGSDDDDLDDGGSPGSDNGGRDEGGPDGGGLGDSGPDDPADGPLPPSLPAIRPRLSDLVIPLVTLLGLADRPGEGHGLGPLDPELCRDLANAAADSPHSEWCVTVTDPTGIAIGHGCAGSARRSAPLPGRRALPARVNLTITSTQLEQLTTASGTSGPHGARAPAEFAFTPRDDPGPPGGYGTWVLTLPGQCDRTVKLEPVPTFDCDHRRESRAYQPNGMLRHLVQVRDYQCTYPTCSRHARESDFEHAQPYDQGGRTCGCNAGARSRQCHMVKQSPGWTVTQPKPGWHQWQTPGGRTYLQGPYRYPV